MTEFSEDSVYQRHPRRRGAVLIIGVGAVGSFLAVELAKLGISPLWLLDCQYLEDANIARHYLGFEERGRPKGKALAERLHRELPTCDATGLDEDFLRMAEHEQIALLNRADVVVAATDSIECQRRINELCVANEIIAVYPGIWVADDIRDAEVGEILRVVPGEGTPCYQCYTAFRSTEVGTEERGGTGTDMKLVSLLTAWLVVSLLDPEDEHADTFVQGQTLTIVHGFMTRSNSVRGLFDSRRTVQNAPVPFPTVRCLVCGQQRQPLPDPTPPTPLGPPSFATRPAPPDPSQWIPSSTPPPSLPPPTIRPPDTPQAPTQRSIPHSVWAWAIAAVVALILLIVIITSQGGQSPSSNAGSQSGPGSGPGVAQPSPVSTLPATASQAFDATPSFQSSGNPAISQTVQDPWGLSFHTTLTPSLQSFELIVKVYTTFNSGQYGGSESAMNAGAPAGDFSRNCMNISPSGNGGTQYFEYPLRTSLSASGNVISGTMTYAAVLPGTYAFDFGCANNSGNTVTVGNVTTSGSGIDDGSASNMNDNGLVIFDVREAASDTVILYGAIGGVGDGSAMHPTVDSCITPSSGSGNWRPAQASAKRVTGTWNWQHLMSRAWFEVGSMTFNQSASQISEATFYYPCNNAQNGVRLP